MSEGSDQLPSEPASNTDPLPSSVESPSAEQDRHAAEGEVYLKRIVRNAGVTVGGNVFGTAIALLIGIVTTNALGPALYGIYTLATSWTGLFAEISRFGFGATLIRFTAAHRGEGRLDKVKGTIFYSMRLVAAVSGVLSILLFFLAEPFCRLVLHNVEAAPAFRFFAGAILLSALYGNIISTLAGFQQQRFTVLANSIGGNLAKLLFLVLFVWLGWGLYAALASSLLQDLFILVVGGILLLRVFPGLRDRSLRIVSNPKELWKYSLALFGTSLFYKYTFNLDVLILGRFGTAVEVGLYGLALKLQPFIFVPANAISEIFNPVVAELYARSDVKQIENVYKTVTKWTLTLSIPIFLVIVLFHGQILSIFGKDFAGASVVLVILATANLLVNFVTMAGHVINMIGRPNVNFVNAILTAVINIGLYFLLIPRYGMMGAAIAYSTGLLVINVLRTVQVWRFLGILPFKGSLIKVVIAAGASISGTYALLLGVPSLETGSVAMLIPLVLLCWGIYAGCLILLKFDDEDRLILDALGKRLRLRRNKT